MPNDVDCGGLTGDDSHCDTVAMAVTMAVTVAAKVMAATVMAATVTMAVGMKVMMRLKICMHPYHQKKERKNRKISAVRRHLLKLNQKQKKQLLKTSCHSKFCITAMYQYCMM